jgi:hypothetical protein
LLVVGDCVEPDETRDPGGVRVVGEEDVIADFIAVEVLEGAVAVCGVVVPGVVVDGVFITVGDSFVEAGEDDLVADYSPGCSTV